MGQKIISATTFLKLSYFSTRKFPTHKFSTHSTPYISSPHKSSPHISSPHKSSPHKSSPHISCPHKSSPHTSSPHVSSPHISSPHKSSPHISSPHISSPHISSPEISPLFSLYNLFTTNRAFPVHVVLKKFYKWYLKNFINFSLLMHVMWYFTTAAAVCHKISIIWFNIIMKVGFPTDAMYIKKQRNRSTAIKSFIGI